MEQTIFKHMETTRDLTLKVFDRIPEELMDVVPEGFNNSIRWNLGHIAFIQDRLVYQVAGEPIGVPYAFEEYFKAETKPANWLGEPPSLEEIKEALISQSGRIKESRKSRLDEALPEPFTNRMGVTFYTKGDTLLFTFYHEAMHYETIKQIYRAIQREQGEAR
ncbi:DinB family protein [Chungangia koreensis]|uniref:DinB family protein n=1 Tax=Chungangia koreensis TaxID=752657 RepID=A0ABV8WZ28_9LACT